MKKCPKCQSIVDDEYECTVCGATITYEPYIDAKPAVARKMWLRHWLPRLALPIAATITVIVCTIIRAWIDQFTLAAVVCLVLSWVSAIFEHRITYAKQWKYNEDYAKFDTRFDGIYGAVFAVIAAVLSLFLG